MNPPKIKSHVQKRGTQPKIFHHKNTERYLKREPEEEGRKKKQRDADFKKKESQSCSGFKGGEMLLNRQKAPENKGRLSGTNWGPQGRRRHLCGSSREFERT